MIVHKHLSVNIQGVSEISKQTPIPLDYHHLFHFFMAINWGEIGTSWCSHVQSINGESLRRLHRDQGSGPFPQHLQTQLFANRSSNGDIGGI